MPNFLCIDTNVPLLDASNIVALGADGTIVCIAETVIDELDTKKSGLNELAYQARSFGRFIASATHLGREEINDLVVTKFNVEGSVVWIISSSQYPDFNDVAQNILNDRKIIEIAYQLQQANIGNVSFMSNDVMCRIRADSLGLPVCDFKEVDKVDYEFTRTLEVDEATFQTLHRKNITEIDPEHKIEHYNYKFTTPGSEQVKIASINNETINILGKETELDLRKQDINPQGVDQLLLSRAILDPTMEMIVCEALAGSGKTVVAISSAIRLIKDKTTPYSSIIYVRSSINDVEAVEEVGFLPGSAEEKNSVYFHPLYDSLDSIVRLRFKSSEIKGEDFEQKVQEKIEKMIKDYHITPMTGLGMRGRTFKDTIFIYDEIQNASKSSLQKALTRIGKNCKIILVGSNNQIDNPNITKFTNGLSVILQDCATRVGGGINKHVVPMQRVVRSAFAEYAENLFTKDK